MKTVSNVIVVGAGPCGSFTALNLAKLGVDAAVFEEHSEIGVPSHCAGHLSIKGLKSLGLYPLPAEIVENTFCGAVFHSPNGKQFEVRFSSPVTCSVNRVLFDKHVADMAQAAGAHYCLNSRVASLVAEDGYVKGVVVKRDGEAEKAFSARTVVDAEGMSSKLLRKANLRSFNRSMVVNAVQAEVENVKDVESDMVEVFLGRNYAPGFYAWLMPKYEGKAKVGLAAKSGNPKEFLHRLMMTHPTASKKLHRAKILRTSFHPITLSGPLPKTYANGFLAVGDVASQVKPTTGGGVIFGMTCAKIAAEVIHETLQRNEFSSEFLGIYQQRCEEILGFDVNVMRRIRTMLDAMPDEKLDGAINFCQRLGLDRTFQKFEDVDFQGRSLLKTLRHPRMLMSLVYFFFFYLSANP